MSASVMPSAPSVPVAHTDRDAKALAMATTTLQNLRNLQASIGYDLDAVDRDRLSQVREGVEAIQRLLRSAA